MRTSMASALSAPRPTWTYTSIETTDAEQHSIVLSDCEHSYEQVKRGPFRGRISQLLLDRVHVMRDQVFNPTGYSGRPHLGWHNFFSFLPTGEAVFSQGRQISENTVLKFPRDYFMRAFCSGPIDCVGVAIRSDAIAGPSRSREERASLESLLDQAICVTNPQVVERFQRGIIDTLTQVDAEPRLVDDVSWRSRVTQDFVEMLTDIVRQGTPAEHELPRPTTRAYIVDKAIEFLHANMSSRPVLSEVCKHVRVSPRTLRYSFEQVVGVSPAHYLLSLRLRGVRQELLSGGGDGGVYRIAQRFGFCHMGRFASFYQEAFGERPSDTCRRSEGARHMRLRRLPALRGRLES